MRALNFAEQIAVAGGTKPTCEIPENGDGVVMTDGCTKTKGNNGFGNGAGDGVPGHSGFEDLTR